MNFLKAPTLIALLSWGLVYSLLLQALLSQPYIGLDWDDLYLQDKQLTSDISVAYTPLIERSTSEYEWHNLSVKRLVEKPHTKATFAELDAIRSYNRIAYELINRSPSMLKIDGEITNLAVVEKPISSLPFGFWIASITSLIALLIGVGVWSLQPKSLSTSLLLACGVFYSIGILATNHYTYRPLVMTPIWFEWSLTIQYLVMGWFPYALLSLLLSYPRKIVNNIILTISFFISILFFANYVNRWFDLPFHTFFINTLIAVLLGTLTIFIQWQTAQNRSIDLAKLRWFIISIYPVPLLMFASFLMPAFFGYTTVIPLWLAQTILLSLFLGLALGIARYRLFDVERWWFKVWIWFISGILLLMLDLGLVFVLGFNTGNALALSLVVLAWVYFPIRQWLWSKLAGTNSDDPAKYLAIVIDAVLLNKQSSSDIKHTWNNILQTVFDPSEIINLSKQVNETNIVENGLYLEVPNVLGQQCVQLVGRSNGTHLFSSQDRDLANTLLTLTKTIVYANEASHKGAKVERQRIIRDLHDDVGANLLTMTYKAESEEQAHLARETLKLMRETVYALDDDEEVYLGTSISEWSNDAQLRCNKARISLAWNTNINLPNVLLLPRQRLNLNRIMREAFSNVLKHGDGDMIEVHLEQNGSLFIICIENQAVLPEPKEWERRTGTNNIERRAAELGGNVVWDSNNSNKSKVSLLISIPLFS